MGVGAGMWVWGLMCGYGGCYVGMGTDMWVWRLIWTDMWVWGLTCGYGD